MTAGTEADLRLARRLKLAGFLLVLGLLIEAVTLFWPHPTAFLVFLLLGGALVAAGILVYLFTIATYSAPSGANPGPR